MTKYSCKIGEFKSSVVVLKDGRAMEVRRGDKTVFAAADPRRYWPNLDAWKATLPTGGVAAITESGRSRADRFATTNPVLARFFERARAKRGDSVRSANIKSLGTREERVRRNIGWYRSYIVTAADAPSWRKQGNAYYEEQVALGEAQLAKLLESGRGSEKLYHVRQSGFFTMLPDGELVSVHYSSWDNLIARRGEVEDGYYTWIPLTDPEMPLWFMAGPNRMIKL
jgi:hypothetical protein